MTVVTVAVDSNVDAARTFAEATHETHPSLVDPEQRLVELLGLTNVPLATWIDESGRIVRLADTAYGAARADATPVDEETRRKQAEQARAAEERMTPAQREVRQHLAAAVDRSGRYEDAIRDWAKRGAGSPYVLTERQVVERSRPRAPEVAMAAAEFALAQHLQRSGDGRDAVAHYKEAHRLDPRGWTYLRQALAAADPDWGQVYERDMMSEIAVVGADTFYSPLEL